MTKIEIRVLNGGGRGGGGAGSLMSHEPWQSMTL